MHQEIEKELVEIKWDAEAAEKGGYEHFMMKEIHEQPKAIADTLNSVLKDGKLDLSAVELSDEEIKKISQIYIVACGSAYHVGVVAQYVMEDLAKIPVRVELASEFRECGVLSYVSLGNGFYTICISPSELSRFLDSDFVKRAELPRKASLSLDEARTETNVVLVQNGESLSSPYTGKNVV